MIKTIKAKDIMRTDIVTVAPDMSVEDLGRMFIEQDLSGAPVVDKDGKLVGIVTANDLISQNRRFHIPTVLRIFDAIIPIEGKEKVEKEIKLMTALVVSEICSTDVTTITEDTLLVDIATIMDEQSIHLLPVMAEGVLKGVVGKREIIKGVSG